MSSELAALMYQHVIEGAATATEMAEQMAYAGLRQALWKPAKKVARKITFGPFTPLYAAGFGVLVHCGSDLSSIHRLLGGEVTEVGPKLVMDVLRKRQLDPLYGDVLSVCQLSIGILSEDPGRNMRAAWQMSEKAFPSWPSSFDPAVATYAYAGWIATAVMMKELVPVTLTGALDRARTLIVESD